jgi:hypothetical protein
MSGGQYPGWLGAIAASVTMLFLGVRTRMLVLPELKTRCSACRRLVWRGRTCHCARPESR